MTNHGVVDHLWWVASRASGVVALGLVALSVGLGLAMAARVVPRSRKVTVLALHEHAALAALVAVAVHAVTLLGDAWLRPGLSGITVPFAMGYRPFWTGLGIVGGYLAAALGLSFYARRRIGPRVWRRAHRFTVVVYLLAVVHTLGAGTDAGSAWLRWFILATAVPMVGLFALRLARRGQPQPRQRRQPRPIQVSQAEGRA